MRHTILILFSMVGTLAWGQLTSNTLTVNAASQAFVASDEAVIMLSVSGPKDATPQQAIAALAAAGITGVQTIPGGSTSGGGVSIWISTPSFGSVSLQSLYLAVPLQTLPSTLNRIADAGAAMIAAQNPYSVRITGAATRVSSGARANVCPPDAAVAAAQAHAKRVAEAAGLVLGPVVGAADSPEAASSVTFAGVGPVIGSYAAFLLGVPVTVAQAPATCALRFTFALSRY